MFVIDKRNKILLTRGDTATIYVEVYDLDGKQYTIQSTDTITMTVRKTSTSTTASLTKTADTSHYITITHADTANLDVGLYVYDVELVTSENNHYTIVPQSYFELKDEVGR